MTDCAPGLSPADLAYAAALVDTFATLKLRALPSGTDLPEVVLQGKRIAALDWLAAVTGSKVAVIGKDFHRHQCSEHCPDKHTRIESSTRRLVLSGARATIVLHALAPFMRVQGAEARRLADAGRVLGYKTNVVNDMRRLGWAVPELREQPRARVVLAS